MEPYLDIATDKVYCSECNKEIIGLTYFAKQQMRASKQIKKREPKSFAVKCPHCKITDRPTVVSKNIICSSCGKPINDISEAFKLMLLEQLKTAGKDIDVK
jgi:ribosomal protein L34E